MELSRGETIRITAVDAVLRLARGRYLSSKELVKEAEEIEKYILGYEAKPEGE